MRLSPMWNETIKKKKTVNPTEGLFFTINNSSWHIGEEVKLDIPEKHSLQQRMTRNNEEILPQTLSPAEWRHKSTMKKLRRSWILDLSREITFLFISINIYCKAAFRITYKTFFWSIKNKTSKTKTKTCVMQMALTQHKYLQSSCCLL